jgi:RimJ/RimL family protein N-acetyltransferase
MLNELQMSPRTITVREITAADAAAYWQLRLQIDRETKFMVLQPDDGTLTTKRLRGRLELMLATDNQTIFVGENGDQLIGFLCATGGVYRHDHHNVQIVLGVLRPFTCQGLGTQLLQACEQWARERHLRRLALTVMTHNHAALALYQKIGFSIEGTAKCALCIDGQSVDLYTMGKCL